MVAGKHLQNQAGLTPIVAVQHKGWLVAKAARSGHGVGLFVAEGAHAGFVVGPTGAHFDPNFDKNFGVHEFF